MMLTFLYLLTICYGENTQEAHNTRLVSSIFGTASLDEIMLIVAIIIGTLVLITICLIGVVIILCVRTRKSVYHTSNGSMSIQYNMPNSDWTKPEKPFSNYSTSYESKTSTTLYPCSSRTDSTTKWLLNSTSPDERLLTCNWAHTDEVIDARKTPKIARRSNVSGLVDFEPVRRLPPPMSPFVREKIVPLQEQLETHSYYSLFDPEDNSFIV